MSRTIRLTSMLILLLFLGGNVVVAHKPTTVPGAIPDPDVASAKPKLAPPQPTVPLDDPDTLISEANVSFTHGGGFLYWENDCVNTVETEPVYIRRRAENGGVIQTLFEVTSPTHDQCESVSKYNVADDSGFFYVNYDQSRLESRLTADPATAIHIADLDNLSPVLATDEDYVYYNQSLGIFRADKDSLDATKINNATDVTGLAVNDTYVYWLDDTGLWRADKTCTLPSCWDDKEQFATVEGEHLTWKDEDELLWVAHDSGYWKIYKELIPSNSTASIYSTPDTGTFGLGRAVYHDDCYYWLENTLYDVINPPNNLLRRKCAGDIDTISEGLMAQDHLGVGTLGVVFADASGIYQVPFDAEAITKDFSLSALEVTQGIQNLFNDVDLVAEKTTYVRVFGFVTANRRADAVQVALYGSRGGSALPGSPLRPINGPQSLAQGDDRDRGDAEDG